MNAIIRHTRQFPQFPQLTAKLTPTHAVELVVSHVSGGRRQESRWWTVLITVNVAGEDRLVKTLQSFVTSDLLLLGTLPDLEDNNKESDEEYDESQPCHDEHQGPITTCRC